MKIDNIELKYTFRVWAVSILLFWGMTGVFGAIAYLSSSEFSMDPLRDVDMIFCGIGMLLLIVIFSFVISIPAMLLFYIAAKNLLFINKSIAVRKTLLSIALALIMMAYFVFIDMGNRPLTTLINTAGLCLPAILGVILVKIPNPEPEEVPTINEFPKTST